MHFAYMFALLLSLFGMYMIDRRFKLCFYTDPRRTAFVLLCSVGVFTVWDLAGIALGIFSKGASDYSLAFELVPQFPIEELLFLLLLSYISLLSYVYITRRTRI